MTVNFELVGGLVALVGTLALAAKLLIGHVINVNNRLLDKAEALDQKQIEQHGEQTLVLKEISGTQKTMCRSQDKLCKTLDGIDLRNGKRRRHR